MSTSINLSSDLNNYLKSSGSSINHGNNGKSLSTPSSNNVMNGWFGDKKPWFSYQLLRNTSEDDLTNGSKSNVDVGSNTGTWFKNPFTTKEVESKGCLPTLSRTQRIIGFLLFMFMGITCFVLSSFYIPLLIFKARKFSILFTFGSAFIVLSFAILLGPVSHLKHQFSRERLPFTLAYFSSLVATLYFALQVQSAILTTLFAIIQVIALVWYTVSYIPGGNSGLLFFSKMAASTVTRTLPV